MQVIDYNCTQNVMLFTGIFQLFASVSKLTGFSIDGTLVGKGLTEVLELSIFKSTLN